MSSIKDFLPATLPEPIAVAPGEFGIAAIGLDHDHVQGICWRLLDEGAELLYVYDPNPAKVAEFREVFPQAEAVDCEERIFSDKRVKLIAAAPVTDERYALGIRVMEAGLDFFVDKAPMTELWQIDKVREAAARTGRKYMVYYGERLSECGVLAGNMVKQNAIGRVLQVMSVAPHRLGTTRPDWFFSKKRSGGILCDLGSHQVEQFFYYTGAKNARVTSSSIANYNHPQHPEFEDFGDLSLAADNGASGYFRVDWFTPNGLSTWGDGRTIILGTDGYIEMRKTINLASGTPGGNHFFWVNHEKEHYMDITDKVGVSFFGDIILDCVNRTENACVQEDIFKAAELYLTAERDAIRLA